MPLFFTLYNSLSLGEENTGQRFMTIIDLDGAKAVYAIHDQQRRRYVQSNQHLGYTKSQ